MMTTLMAVHRVVLIQGALDKSVPVSGCLNRRLVCCQRIEVVYQSIHLAWLRNQDNLGRRPPLAQAVQRYQIQNRRAAGDPHDLELAAQVVIQIYVAPDEIAQFRDHAFSSKTRAALLHHPVWSAAAPP